MSIKWIKCSDRLPPKQLEYNCKLTLVNGEIINGDYSKLASGGHQFFGKHAMRLHPSEVLSWAEINDTEGLR